MGFSPISYTEILSFSKLYCIDLLPVEIDLILLIDGVVSEYFAEKEQNAEKNKEVKNKPKR